MTRATEATSKVHVRGLNDPVIFALNETAKKNDRSLEAEVCHAIRQNLDNATEPLGARPDLTVERARGGLEAARQLSPRADESAK